MTNTCPRCRHQFQTLTEEYGEHPCPKCGWEQDDPCDTCPLYSRECVQAGCVPTCERKEINE